MFSKMCPYPCPPYLIDPVPRADVVGHDDPIIAAQLVHGPLYEVHALTVRRHVHVCERIVAGLVPEQVPLQVAAGLRERLQRVELRYRSVQVSHDDPPDVGACIVQDLYDLYRRSLMPSRMDQYRGPSLTLSHRRRSKRLALVIGQRPCASDLANDACPHVGAVSPLLNVLDDPARQVVLGA